MEKIIIGAVILSIFLWLFIRDCQLDHKRTLEMKRKGDLQLLKKFQVYFIENNIEPEHDFDAEIKLLEKQNFRITIWDYFPLFKRNTT